MKVGGMQKADLMKACLEKERDLLGFVNSPQPTRAHLNLRGLDAFYRNRNNNPDCECSKSAQ